MPNHVTTEVIFRNIIDATTQNSILEKCCNRKEEVDFAILLPVPLNCWMHSVGKPERDAFPDTALDWCSKNWSTKWNAYQHRAPIITDDSLTLAFDTAWSTPRGWLVAVFNTFRISFEYNWYDEGDDHAVHGEFRVEPEANVMGDTWSEGPATDEVSRRLHKMKWGVSTPEEMDEL